MANIIIFTNNYTSNENCNPFNLFGVSNYYGPEEANSCHTLALSYDNKSSKSDKINDSFDLLFFADIPYSKFEHKKKVINNFVEKDQEVYVILHANPDNPEIKETHKELLKYIYGDNFNNFIEESHVTGSVYYDEICKIAKFKRETDFSKYQEQLKRIEERFPYPLLEAKLLIWKHLNNQYHNTPDNFEAAKEKINEKIAPYIKNSEQELTPWQSFTEGNFNEVGLSVLYERLFDW